MATTTRLSCARLVSGHVLVALALSVAPAGCSSNNSSSVIGPDGAVVFTDKGDAGTGLALPDGGGAVVVTGDTGAPGVTHDGAAGPDGATSGVDAKGTTGIDAGGGGGVDATMPPVDSGSTPTAAENEWLVPMNAARAAVGEAPLHWDPIAEAVATAYANACDYVHNPNRQAQYDAMSGTDIYIGENIAAGEPTESVAEACSDWIAEKQYFTNSPTGGTCDAPDDGECGHYTQIVWSTTTGVGCAQATCSAATSPFSGTNSTWVYSVCDYSPGGNIVGEAPY